MKEVLIVAGVALLALPVLILTPLLRPARVCDSVVFAASAHALRLTVPATWRSAPPQHFEVPGEVLAAWHIGPRADFVLFRQKPARPFTPEALLRGSAAARTADPVSARVVTRETCRVGGLQAIRLDVRAAGRGAAIGRGGAIETRQLWIAVPRADDVLVFLLTCPAGDATGIDDEVERLLASVQLGGDQTAVQVPSGG